MVLVMMASSSVAPAQMIPASFTKSEPLISTSVLPKPIIPVPVEALPDATPVTQDHTAAIPSIAAEIAKIPGESLAAMVSRLRNSATASREIECLAGAIYFESKGEPLAGQLAVGEVIANRVSSGRFASSYCGVVFQRGQFSFVRGGQMPAIPRSGLQWKTAVAIAAIVDARLSRSTAPRSLFFHASRVSPPWHATRVAAIGNHIFYR